MSYLSQLGLMLWKNWILQRRRVCVTIFEIIIPLFFACLLLIVRQKVNTEPQNNATLYEPTKASEHRGCLYLDNSDKNQEYFIGYTPKGKEVEVVMSYIEELYAENCHGNNVPIARGFNDEGHMEEYAKGHPGQVVMGVAFLNLEDGSNNGDGGGSKSPSNQNSSSSTTSSWTDLLPKDLHLVIRPPTNDYTYWHTDRTFYTFQPAHPSGGNYEYRSEGILDFQQIVGEAVSKYWLSKTSGGNPNSTVRSGDAQVNIKTQCLPYPPYIHDPMIGVVQDSFPAILVLSLILSVVINTKNLVYEKEKKLKESMKLMGLSASVHWVSWFLTFCLYMVPILGLYAVFLGVPIIGDNGAILQQSDTSVILVFLLAYGLSAITFSFMISSVFQKANVASVVAGILFFGTFCPRQYLSDNYDDMTKTRKISFSLLSNCAMIFGANIIGFYEGTGEGANWTNFHKPATKDDNLSLLECILMLLLDSVLHLLVFWYLDNVRPGEFGVPKPFYFCFTKSYWCGTKQQEASMPRKQSDSGARVRFESEPENFNPGITINRLTKVYGKKTVVDDLSLTMYQGQIFALLGHNGAGKTTTMSMLTGFIPPTRGSAVVNGYNITQNMAGVRSSLGLCPQHNILFDTLTVKEHLQFFARLKGATSKQADEEIDPLLTEVGLLDMKNKRSATLSGGQKRKLSVAIALIAGSKIVILDEPSSGMDPAARRQTWTALQNHREGRTILLTTHYMDEADVLGDRIAIMAEGLVKCCGSSMFLKKLYGAGYHLVIVKDSTCNVDDVTRVITDHVTTAKLESIINQEVTYLLLEKETPKFADLFRKLEEQKEALGISSFGTSATTMEEVFLKVGESAHHHDDDDDSNNTVVGDAVGEIDEVGDALISSSLVEGEGGDNEKTPLTEEAPDLVVNVDTTAPGVKFSPSDGKNTQIVNMGNNSGTKFITGYEKSTGLSLELGKMRGIFVKKALNTWRNRIISLVQLSLPVIFAAIALLIDGIQYEKYEAPPLTLDLANFDRTVVMTTAGVNPSPQAVRLQMYYDRQFGNWQTVKPFNMSLYSSYDTFALRQAKEMGLGLYNKRVIVGLEIDSAEDGSYLTAISHYNGYPIHSEPIAMSYLMNAVLQTYLDSDDYSIETIFHPLPRVHKVTAERDISYSESIGFSIAFLISFGMAFLTTLYVHYLIKERQVGAKHLQVVSGVSPVSYWLPTFVWDFISYLLPVICLLIIFAAFNLTAFVDGNNSLVVLFHLLMYGWAVLPLMYALQFLFTNPPTGVNTILAINIFSGLFCLLTILILTGLKQETEGLHLLFMLLFPNYSMAQGLVDIYTLYHTNKVCPQVPCIEGSKHQCCQEDGLVPNYLSMDRPGIGKNLLVFFISGIAYFLIIFLIEYHMLQKLWYRIVRVFSKPEVAQNGESAALFVDSDVAEESDRIHNTSLEDLNKTDSLLLVDLYKRYGNMKAVDHLCLGIPRQECFGLLGQNGAGKTTTFKMLTGDVMVTGGNAYLAGHDICNHIKQVQANMGYCPQFDALIDQMTGRETLTMYARLKGVPAALVKEVVDNLIEVLMLDAHADKLSGNYSGGNKRKLSTAIALVGMPHFIMLDEPSAGMDPKTRRQLWNVLSQVRAAGHTLILTSHSMEECDALCTRLAIMVNGQFVCLGSSQHLKNKFGEGYTLIVQLGLGEDGQRQATQPIADYMAKYLPGIKVFDDHQGYVHFQVPDSTFKLADVFSLMEATKEYFNIRDYSVHQTTLEQVFLTFTRAQNQGPSGNQGKMSLKCCCCH